MRWGVLELEADTAYPGECRRICDEVVAAWREIERATIALMVPSQQGKIDMWRGKRVYLLGPEVAAQYLEREVKAAHPSLVVSFRELSDEEFEEARKRIELAVQLPETL